MRPQARFARCPPRGRAAPSGRPSGAALLRRGFTLVEVLVALLVMAILAALAWQGLDGIQRSRDVNNDALDRTFRLNTALTQWEQDLQALHNLGAIVPPIAFDGQTLRLTRRVEGGVVLVAWAVRGGVWQRWASAPMTKVGELQEGWLRSQQLLGNEAGQVTLAQASTWQVYFYRGNAWSNAQSSAGAELPGAATAPPPVAPPPQPPATPPSGAGPGTPPPPAPPAPTAPTPGTGGEALPLAVRLVITLPGGDLTRDVALGPAGG